MTPVCLQTNWMCVWMNESQIDGTVQQTAMISDSIECFYVRRLVRFFFSGVLMCLLTVQDIHHVYRSLFCALNQTISVNNRSIARFWLALKNWFEFPRTNLMKRLALSFQRMPHWSNESKISQFVRLTTEQFKISWKVCVMNCIL